MPSSRPKVLLVLDEPILGAITEFRLELMGFQVERVGAAEEALAAIERDRPGLIVVDLMLNGSQGYAIVDRLSNDERTGAIPVLALSSNAELDAVQRAHAAGADDYLVTPYDPAVLEDKLHHWLPMNE